VSAAVLLVNGYLYIAVHRRHIGYGVPAGVIFLALLISGSLQLSRRQVMPDTVPTVAVALLQPNIDQYKKWSPAFEQEIRSTIARLVTRAAAARPDVIVWPETAVPGYLPDDALLAGWVSRLARTSNAWQIVGTPYHSAANTYGNASLLLSPEGSTRAVHIKNHLVPFGEYVPLRKYLEPYFSILNSLGDFTRGTDANVFHTGTATWGVSICSENFFGAQVSRSVRGGAGILVNQTNDAWFLKSPAAEQHFGMNVFRAIENRRPVVVCGNTGISGCITPAGTIVARTGLFAEDVRIVSVTPAAESTVYTRQGDLFARGAVGLTMLFGLAAAIIAGRRKREVQHV
jgi:apolipoprotein N-acyltransferase